MCCGEDRGYSYVFTHIVLGRKSSLDAFCDYYLLDLRPGCIVFVAAAEVCKSGVAIRNSHGRVRVGLRPASETANNYTGEVYTSSLASSATVSRGSVLTEPNWVIRACVESTVSRGAARVKCEKHRRLFLRFFSRLGKTCRGPPE